MVRSKKRKKYCLIQDITQAHMANALWRSDKFLLINRNTDGVKRNRKIKPIVFGVEIC